MIEREGIVNGVRELARQAGHALGAAQRFAHRFRNLLRVGWTEWTGWTVSPVSPALVGGLIRAPSAIEALNLGVPDPRECAQNEKRDQCTTRRVQDLLKFRRCENFNCAASVLHNWNGIHFVVVFWEVPPRLREIEQGVHRHPQIVLRPWR